MKLLLDTHALLWFAAADPRLPARVSSLITDPATEVAVSIASFWEIGIKISAGKLTLGAGLVALRDLALNQGIELLPITIEAIDRTAQMDWFNKDPFDRIIAATALTQGLGLATIEQSFERWGVVRVWD